MKKLDLSVAINCIKGMKKDSVYNNQKIALVLEDIPSMNGYKKGEVVLFRDREKSDRGLETVTIEIPYNSEQIAEQIARNSLIRTGGLTLFVPSKYIMEIKI